MLLRAVGSIRQSHAKQIWMDYLKLCIEYPALASGEITEKSPEYKQYEWFVAYLLERL